MPPDRAAHSPSDGAYYNDNERQCKNIQPNPDGGHYRSRKVLITVIRAVAICPDSRHPLSIEIYRITAPNPQAATPKYAERLYIIVPNAIVIIDNSSSAFWYTHRLNVAHGPDDQDHHSSQEQYELQWTWGRRHIRLPAAAWNLLRILP